MNGAMKKWARYWNEQNYSVLNWPTHIQKKNFYKEWPKVHQKFYTSLQKADIHFIANEDKGEQKAYVGNGTFAEIAFSVGLNLTRKKKIRVILAQEPDKAGVFYDDLNRWLKLGWLEVLSVLK